MALYGAVCILAIQPHPRGRPRSIEPRAHARPMVLQLPLDLLRKILLSLLPSDLITCSLVCRLLWLECERDDVWVAHAEKAGAAPGDAFTMLPYKRRYRIMSRSMTAAPTPRPEEEMMDMLWEQFDWVVTLRQSGADSAVVGNTSDVYPVEGLVGCALRADFESLPMPPSCCALNDGLIPADTATWRPGGQLIVSIFAIRVADDQIGQITSFELDLDQLQEGDVNALLQDWEEGVEAVASWGARFEGPWPAPEHVPMRVGHESGHVHGIAHGCMHGRGARVYRR